MLNRKACLFCFYVCNIIGECKRSQSSRRSPSVRVQTETRVHQASEGRLNTASGFSDSATLIDAQTEVLPGVSDPPAEPGSVHVVLMDVDAFGTFSMFLPVKTMIFRFGKKFFQLNGMK